jgi:predicted ester cyclase
MSAATLTANKEIVRRWIDEVFNRQDMLAIDKLKVSSYLDWTPFPTQRLELPVSGLKESLPKFLSSYPDLEFTANEMLAEGDFVVCLGHWQATHQEEYMGVTPTNRLVGGERLDIFRIVDDKMAEHWGCGNELAFLQLLGTISSEKKRNSIQQDNKSIACQFVEEVSNRRNLAAVAELVDTRAIDHSSQSLTLFFILTAFPDLYVTIENVIAEGDKVTVLSTFRATHQGEFMGIPPTSKPVAGQRVDVFRIVDGKILESWQEWDGLSLVEQISA